MKTLSREEMKNLMGGYAPKGSCSALPSSCSADSDCSGDKICKTVHCEDGDFKWCA